MPGYSLIWARNVVKLHYSQYARVSYFLLKHTHFTSDSVARWLANSKTSRASADLWRFWKHLVELLDRRSSHLATQTTTRPYSKQMLAIWSEVFWEIGENCPPGLSTAWEYWVEHEEQFLKARPEVVRSRKTAHPKDGQFDFGGDDGR